MNEVIDTKKADETEAEKVVIVDGTSVDEISQKLKALGVEEAVIAKIKTDLGATNVDDLSGLTEKDLLDCGMKPLPARNLLKKFILTETEPRPTEKISVIESAPATATSMLEQLPPEDSLLSSLKVGGVLRIEHARVVMAGRCLWARQTNVYGADKRLMDLIDYHYTNVDPAPNPPIFWELHKGRTKNRFASVFNTLDMAGAGSYATASARNAFWERMNQYFIPTMQEVQRQLTVWYDTWVKQSQANMSINIGAALGSTGVVPRSKMPVTSNILAAIDAMIDSVNKVFAGKNEVVAIALGVEAHRMKEILKRTDIHAYTGLGSRELMLRKLNIATTNDKILMESDFTTYLHNILRTSSLSTGPSTAFFLQELQEIGENLDWKLLGKRIDSKPSSAELTGIGSKRKHGEEDDDGWDDTES